MVNYSELKFTIVFFVRALPYNNILTNEKNID